MLQAFTAHSVYTAEAPSLAAGLPLMATAAQALADRVLRIFYDQQTNPSLVTKPDVVIFAGRGNNGGDGLYAAVHLVHTGLTVEVAIVADLAGTETQEAVREVQAAGIAVRTDFDAIAQAARGARVWVDALAGIGMKPPARGQLGEIIDLLGRVRTERDREPIVVAVDVPSGLNADTGEVEGPVVQAHITVTFGGYKAVHFLPPAAYHCGQVDLVTIGIEAELACQPAEVTRVELNDLRQWWLRPGPSDHKYTRGVVGMVTGSWDYPGAGVLSVGGALAVGPGMVRYLGQAHSAVVAAHPEAIVQPGRVQAWVVGSGITGRTASCGQQVDDAIQAALAQDLPLVVDAGALEWVEGSTIGGVAMTDRVVLTPHAGELAELLSRIWSSVDRRDVEGNPSYWARKAAITTGATVVLKGGITLVVSAQGDVLSQDDGTAWMATAGTGDVLAGILGTILAQWQVRREGRVPHPPISRIVAAGVALHGASGRKASGGGPVRASEIVPAVAETLRATLAH